MVDGLDRFLLNQIELAESRRANFWKRNLADSEQYRKSVKPNRERLNYILGRPSSNNQDEVVSTLDGFERVGYGGETSVVAKRPGYTISRVRWSAGVGDIYGEGLLLEPEGKTPIADVVAMPDCEQSPEQLVGLTAGIPAESQFARRLAESGCRVVVPFLIPRRESLTRRELLYRSAFELGQHLIGYEARKAQSAAGALAWLNKSDKAIPQGIIGYGEGGMIALCAAAMNDSFDAICVSGYFDDRRQSWQEPIDRNVFGRLEQFGDAELVSLIAPGAVIIEAARAPEAEFSGKGGGAPARLVTPELASVQREFTRAQAMVSGLKDASLELIVSGEGRGPYGSAAALTAFLKHLKPKAELTAATAPPAAIASNNEEEQCRLARQIHEIDRHNQWLLNESAYVRQTFMKQLDTSSVAKHEATVEPYRQKFYNEVIGRFDEATLPFNPRSRKFLESEHWTAYEVVLDVFPDVFAYGLLLLPKDLKPSEKRPVVVCQHGLEGRPQHTIGKEGFANYSAFAATLADRGFITFAPQNPYIFKDRFRTLQRKANPLGKTLFSIIIPQHQQIVDWLQTLPQVDPERIAFYGLSYGGKTAMRVPAVVTDYALSICSADFNEWVWKNASTRSPYSYANKGEYEIFEFDLGSTFNYSEMAALIAPRPFMVERGHFDGVAPDEAVAYEYAKVQFLYAARLGIPDRSEIEWFVGPHKINGVGTYKFLHKHLNWPEPK
jgi:dienelactone hydrolase